MKPIFIFSLPRSGSTLLQRILATSGQVATVSEPWLLLPFACTLKADGVKSQYGHGYAVKAIRDFYQQLPNGRRDYLDELRAFALNLYQKNSPPGSRYFLDKTPRYHLIVNEIFEIFPEAKFVFLWRNPLAVIASIINSWCKGKWKPQVWQLDLYDGSRNLINAYNEHSSQVHALQYERLVQSPARELKRLCDYLELEYTGKMIESFQDVSLEGSLGDKTGIREYQVLSDNSLAKWQKTFNNPFRRRWAIRYLAWLGEEHLHAMGYSLGDLTALVSKKTDLNLDGMFSDLLRSALYPPVNFLLSRRERKTPPAGHLY
ncbi:MAG: sulfotransferase [Proteobacteria bacterium]|nr:sulfotransferase [Pseudomonadota bacterium]MBU1739419.1 sulfotransferase [Pseudomonadota bacterium]